MSVTFTFSVIPANQRIPPAQGLTFFSAITNPTGFISFCIFALITDITLISSTPRFKFWVRSREFCVYSRVIWFLRSDYLRCNSTFIIVCQWISIRWYLFYYGCSPDNLTVKLHTRAFASPRLKLNFLCKLQTLVCTTSLAAVSQYSSLVLISTSPANWPPFPCRMLRSLRSFRHPGAQPDGYFIY